MKISYFYRKTDETGKFPTLKRAQTTKTNPIRSFADIDLATEVALRKQKLLWDFIDPVHFNFSVEKSKCHEDYICRKINDFIGFKIKIVTDAYYHDGSADSVFTLILDGFH